MLKWISKKRNQKGFTLIELVVVIAILGILAAIAIPRFMNQTDGARLAADKATARTIASAINIAIASGDYRMTATAIEKKTDDGAGNITWADVTATILTELSPEYLEADLTPQQGGSFSVTVNADGVKIVNGTTPLYPLN